MDNDRELFEAKFPPSKWIEWCDTTKRYEALVMNAEDLDDAASHNLAFAAWQEARHKTELATYVNYPEYRDKNTMEKRIQALEKEVAFYRGCFEQMAVHPRSTTVELGPAGYYRLSKLALNGPPSESSEKTTPQE